MTALELVADLLACPHCTAPLEPDGSRLVCPAGHSFDIARQGYLNLLPGPAPGHADTAAMVSARERFLTAGPYDPLLGALRETVAGPTVLDAGAGPGWYLAGLVPSGGRGLALDVSVPAVRRAARVHPRIGAVVADTWARLPVRDGVADTVLSIFAPRNPAEFARVLVPGGRLVVAAAEPDHLTALRDRYGLIGVQQDKQQRLERSLSGLFTVEQSVRVEFPARLDAAGVDDLIAMGPNAFHHHTGPVHRPGELQVTAAVRITVAQRVSDGSPSCSNWVR